MTYEIKVPIEQGSPEDLLLREAIDPAAHILSLLQEAARHKGSTRKAKKFNESDVAAFRKLDPCFSIASQYSDEQLKAMQDNARRIRKRGLSNRA
ncbi:MAG: hypothetical protein ACAH95_00730 [Fimbriimonas sp.]